MSEEELNEFHHDPYGAMTDEEFEREMTRSLRPLSTPVSIRIPVDLLERAKRLAARRGIGYQTLIKRLVAAGVDRLERTGS
jgi:predicted DNA binding CopG/RHH family protein